MGRKRATVELFEAIRREYEHGVGTVKGVARKLGVHRRMVREALADAVPRAKRKPERARPAVGPVIEFVERVLRADRKAPRKQRHTAHRIHRRIQEEMPGHAVSESTIRRYVSRRKVELGLTERETFVPQSYRWGVEGQVDWYQAQAIIGGEQRVLQVFSMRSMASGAAFHRAYFRTTQQAFLEAHEEAFAYFGGVFQQLRFDNLASAVKKILRGHRREETTRFMAFRSHWGFASEFCNPAAGHEKGGVEGEAGYFRRNHWVPVPEAADLQELNERLLRFCQADETRRIAGHELTVGARVLQEREHLLPLATNRFDLAEISFPTVDSSGCVRVRTNAYSVRLRAGQTVQAKVYSNIVELWHESLCVGRHERSYGKLQQVLDLEHYLDVLERKPGALAGSKPLEQCRNSGRWPASYDRFWEGLMRRYGKQQGTREMIAVIKLNGVHGSVKLRQAIESAMELGCHHLAAVEYLLTADRLSRTVPEMVEIGLLDRYERPMPVMTGYDQLLEKAVTA
jgi:transposase